MGKPKAYVPGQHYKVKTLEDCIALAAKLPPERAEVFLSEISMGLRMQCTLRRKVSNLRGFKKMLSRGFTWVDDDKGDFTDSIEVRFSA